MRFPGFDHTLELAHLLATIDHAAHLLDEDCRDIDASILRAHGAELAAGREWPGMAVRSTSAANRDLRPA